MEASQPENTGTNDTGGTGSPRTDSLLQNVTEQRQRFAGHIAESHRQIGELQSEQPGIERGIQELEARLNPQPECDRPNQAPEREPSRQRQHSTPEPERNIADDLGR